jgi:hypothetical protein
MRNLRIFACIILIVTAFIKEVASQQKGIGGALIYNFQTQSLGIDIRSEFPIKKVKFLEGLTVAPQLAYFPWFNKVSEFYIGSSFHLGVYSLGNWVFYGLANISYNGWLNYNKSAMSNAKFSNLGIDGGVGVTNKSCLRPFMELRYNLKWKECGLRLGLIYSLKCDQRGMVPCPKIPPPPQF